jgi:hypothetical protein
MPQAFYAGLPTELPKGSIHECRVEFEAGIGNEALCVQVNHSDDSAPAGHFGGEAHVAKAHLKTVSLRLNACERKSRKAQEFSCRSALDGIVERQRFLRLETYVRQIWIENSSRAKRYVDVNDGVVRFDDS